ncbi:MAG: hypothetical protein HRT89_17300 [Lentisphaeria bacterium]|nr:hypothetical protein [Lentisphaeria bacterium]
MRFHLLFLSFIFVLQGAEKITYSKIAPILRSSCVKCHGPKKKKGKIRLDSPAEIRKSVMRKGIIVPGDPNDSPLYSTTVLPDGDEDKMPSEGKALSKAKTTLLFKWIKQGAIMNDGKPLIRKAGGTAKAPKLDAKVKKSFNDENIVITYYGHYGYGFILRYVEPHNFSKAYKKIAPYKDEIWHLDLSRQRLTGEIIKDLQTYPMLNRLDLRSCSISVNDLLKLNKLKWLNLYDARVSGDMNKLLKGLSNVEKIYLPSNHIGGQMNGLRNNYSNVAN